MSSLSAVGSPPQVEFAPIQKGEDTKQEETKQTESQGQLQTSSGPVQVTVEASGSNASLVTQNPRPSRLSCCIKAICECIRRIVWPRGQSHCTNFWQGVGLMILGGAIAWALWLIFTDDRFKLI